MIKPKNGTPVYPVNNPSECFFCKSEVIRGWCYVNDSEDQCLYAVTGCHTCITRMSRYRSEYFDLNNWIRGEFVPPSGFRTFPYAVANQCIYCMGPSVGQHDKIDNRFIVPCCKACKRILSLQDLDMKSIELRAWRVSKYRVVKNPIFQEFIKSLYTHVWQRVVFDENQNAKVVDVDDQFLTEEEKQIKEASYLVQSTL